MQPLYVKSMYRVNKKSEVYKIQKGYFL